MPDLPTLHIIPGSPSSWRVWLTIQWMDFPCRVERLSFNAGDTRSEAYQRLNWRGQVPVLVAGDLVLAESFAIIEFLDETRDPAGRSAWPGGPALRARARSVAHAVDGNLGMRVYRPLADQLFLTAPRMQDRTIVAKALEVGRTELDWLERELTAGFLAGDEPCAADFTAYGLIAFLAQIERHHAEAALRAQRGPRTKAWRRRIEALPGFPNTWPEHWPAVADT